jgi:hypothetical protein
MSDDRWTNKIIRGIDPRSFLVPTEDRGNESLKPRGIDHPSSTIGHRPFGRRDEIA